MVFEKGNTSAKKHGYSSGAGYLAEYHIWKQACGRAQTLAQWANELSIPVDTLAMRLGTHGESVERAFTQPLRKHCSRPG